MNKIKKLFFEYLSIFVGGLLYGLGTIMFVFPHNILLGGTSGVSVILTTFIPLTPATFSVIINTLLLFLALIILGKSMALKTLVGSIITTLFIALFEIIFKNAVIITSPLLSAVFGGLIIAIASALMFYVDSSSGGTDIIALIIKKFSNIRIGRALLISDVLIVIIGGLIGGWEIALCSFVGFLIKAFGIDFFIKLISKIKTKRS